MSRWIAISNCESCIESNNQYKEQGFDVPLQCDTCFPGVHRYNKAAYEVYAECSNQYIMSMSGVVGLNLLAVDSIMNDFNITDGSDRIAIRREVNHLSGKVRKIQEEQAKARASK